jgi:D-alanyl-lipoteichoic acid acyltransferase DltB (MBOAT superfamily)
VASFFFYGWWSIKYLPLLLFSISFNFISGLLINKFNIAKRKKIATIILAGAIIANLYLLGYYKYANFFLETVQFFGGEKYRIENLILPLGISFFTFTQIAFLVDAWNNKAREYNFVDYALFVTYFPHLIAGPILHHREMIPQFREENSRKFSYENLSVGLTVFTIGLFKKVMIADNMALYADPVFDTHNSPIQLTFLSSWLGATAYTFQLYFDFSGYSDMAIGISRVFGIKLPINFYSPYKANNIIDFWRRWHITLSRFFKEYLYIPLGGNRKGKIQNYINIMITMVLGGLWHGASWNFVVWGFLHGLYLAVNNIWQALFPQQNENLISGIYRFITFLAVVIAWVFFRAENMGSALGILAAMSGQNGIQLEDLYGLYQTKEIYWIFVLLLFVWFLPNTSQIMKNFDPALPFAGEIGLEKKMRILEWQPNGFWALTYCFILFFVILHISKETTFLYYQF